MICLQTVYFFFDDSGVLHKNERSGYFVYAGFVFVSRSELESAKRKYICANKNIRKETELDGELKASVLKNKYKRSLFNAVRQYQSLSVAVDISRVYDHILNNKKSVCRYKDYVLKRAVKEKLKNLISNGIIDKDQEIEIFIYIDEQLTATNGYYDLRDSIAEELQYGVANFDYGVVHGKVFDSNVTVHICYCESKKYYLIQASDILANRIWHSYKDGNPKLREIPNHLSLTFP